LARKIWSLIAYLQGNQWDRVAAAEDFEVPTDAVHAAAAFYERNQKPIDARIAVNDQIHAVA
jgi:hypothetical protein